MVELREKSHLAAFICDFTNNWLQRLNKNYPDVFNMQHVRSRMRADAAIDHHREFFMEYCKHLGFSATLGFEIYQASFYWKSRKESVHLFKLGYEQITSRVAWFQKQLASANQAARLAAVLKAAAAPPIVLELDRTTYDLPLVYWAMLYEVEERFETSLAEIAADGQF